MAENSPKGVSGTMYAREPAYPGAYLHATASSQITLILVRALYRSTTSFSAGRRIQTLAQPPNKTGGPPTNSDVQRNLRLKGLIMLRHGALAVGLLACMEIGPTRRRNARLRARPNHSCTPFPSEANLSGLIAATK